MLVAAYIDTHPAKENSIIMFLRLDIVDNYFPCTMKQFLRVSIKYRQSYCIFGEILLYRKIYSRKQIYKNFLTKTIYNYIHVINKKQQKVRNVHSTKKKKEQYIYIYILQCALHNR